MAKIKPRPRIVMAVIMSIFDFMLLDKMVLIEIYLILKVARSSAKESSGWPFCRPFNFDFVFAAFSVRMCVKRVFFARASVAISVASSSVRCVLLGARVAASIRSKSVFFAAERRGARDVFEFMSPV